MANQIVQTLVKNLNMVFVNLTLEIIALEVDGKISIHNQGKEIGIKEAFNLIKEEIPNNINDLESIDNAVTGLNNIVESLGYDVKTDGFGYTQEKVFAITGDDIDDFEEGIDFLLSEMPDVFSKP